jgi:osmotically-inducible protein OsmY
LKNLSIILLFALTIPATALANSGTKHDKSDEDLVTTLSETQIYSSLWAKYAVDGNLNPFDMKIKVEDQTITLKGTVDTKAEKILAGEIAESMNGITEIHNHLTVVNDGNRGTKDFVNNTAKKIENLTTDAKIETRLTFNKHVMGNDVDVKVKGDKAILKGTVDNRRAYTVAETIAKDTPGIHYVENHIKITKSNNEKPVSDMIYSEMMRLSDMAEDSWVEAKVETELMLSNAIETEKIDIEVVDGLVILTGSVPTDTQRDLIEHKIEDIAGVKEIENRLTVS